MNNFMSSINLQEELSKKGFDEYLTEKLGQNFSIEKNTITVNKTQHEVHYFLELGEKSGCKTFWINSPTDSYKNLDIHQDITFDFLEGLSNLNDVFNSPYYKINRDNDGTYEIAAGISKVKHVYHISSSTAIGNHSHPHVNNNYERD